MVYYIMRATRALARPSYRVGSVSRRSMMAMADKIKAKVRTIAQFGQTDQDFVRYIQSLTQNGFFKINTIFSLLGKS